MTTYKCGARKIQALIMNCSKIDACATLLETLLSQCPLGVNFHTRRNGPDLVFAGDHHPSIWLEGLSCLFADTRKKERFWSGNITLKRYIFHGFNYTNETKFEFSAEQMEIITKLAVIEKDYIKEEKANQQKLCSKYIAQSSPALDDSSKDNEVKRLTR